MSFLFGLTSSTVSGVFCRLVESGRISIDVRFESDLRVSGSKSPRRSPRSANCRRTPSARKRTRRVA